MKEHGVNGTPTVLLLDAQGKEIERICGFDGKKDEYFLTLLDFASGRNTLSTLLAQMQSSPDSAEMNYRVAQRYLNRWEEELASPYFAKVIELDPEDKFGWKTDAIYQISLNDARSNQNFEPLRQFLRATKDQKYLFGGYINLAVSLTRAKKTEEAGAAYEEALQRLPEHPGLMNQYASFIFQRKLEDKYALGLELAKNAISLDKEQLFFGYYNLVQYFRLTKDVDGLLQIYEEGLAKLPEETFFMNAYGKAVVEFQIESQYDRGIELVKKAIDNQPEMAAYWDSLGWLYYRKGEHEKAVDAMKKAAEIDPKNDKYTRALKKFQEEVN